MKLFHWQLWGAHTVVIAFAFVLVISDNRILRFYKGLVGPVLLKGLGWSVWLLDPRWKAEVRNAAATPKHSMVALLCECVCICISVCLCLCLLHWLWIYSQTLNPQTKICLRMESVSWFVFLQYLCSLDLCSIFSSWEQSFSSTPAAFVFLRLPVSIKIMMLTNRTDYGNKKRNRDL